MRRLLWLMLATAMAPVWGDINCESAFVQQNLLTLQDDPIAREQARRNLRDCGDSAMPEMLQMLQSRESSAERRLAVVNLLAQLSPRDEMTVVLLDKLKHDPDLTVRRDVARTLGRHSNATHQVVGALVQVLQDRSEHELVRGVAADALAALGGDANALQALQTVLSDAQESTNVRIDALAALRRLGHLAVESLPVLLHEYLDPRSFLEKTVLRDAIVDITKDLVVKERLDAEGWVEQAQQLMGKNKVKDIPGLDQVEFSLWHATKYLDTLRWEQRFKSVEALKGWTAENQWVIAGPVYVVWLLLWLLIYRLYPLAILNASGHFEGINRLLPNTLSALPVKFFVFIPMLQHRSRVLDAWVKRELATAQARYELQPLTRAHKHYVPTQFQLAGEVQEKVGSEAMRQLFRFQHSQLCLLIWGEGGSGKSSLAVEMARCCLQREHILGPKPMLPVILDRDLKADETLLAYISQQLHNLLDKPADSLSDDLVVALLKNKRILLLVDHLSELDEHTREMIQPTSKTFLPRVLIITSRRDELLDNATRHVLQPQRLSGRQLADFCDGYLEARGKRKLYNDRDFFELCKSLIRLAGEDGITPLFATLFVDQMAYARSQGRDTEGPHSIPELMLHYLNTLNRAVPSDERIADRKLHRMAELLAWLCLRRNFRPMAVVEEEVVSLSKGLIGAAQLNYLQHRLRLIDSISPAQDRIAFCIKPLAEHLAARHVVRLLGSSEENWKQFILRCRQQLKSDPAVVSFVQAVAQCAQTYGNELQLPPFVVASLSPRRQVAQPA